MLGGGRWALGVGRWTLDGVFGNAGGMIDNSPAIHRWEHKPPSASSPGGTVEHRVYTFPQKPYDSVRAFFLFCVRLMASEIRELILRTNRA